MADYNSELPVRSQLPGQVLPDDVIIKIGDASNPTTQLASVDTYGSLQSRIADASGNVIASQNLSSSYWLQVVSPAIGAASPGTAAAYSDLAGGIYNSPGITLTAGQQASLQLDASGNLLVDLATSLPAGSATIGSVNQAGAPWSVTDTNFPNPVDTNYGTVDSSTIRTAAQIGNATGAADFNNGATGAQTLRVAANLAVAGANVSVSNPVPVTITSASSGTPIQNYQTSASLAAGSNVTLTYTVPATHTFSLERIWCSCESRIKVLVVINTVNAYVAFNSSASPNIDITVTAPPTLTAAETVAVTFYNIDNGSTNVYLTIEGNQIS